MQNNNAINNYSIVAQIGQSFTAACTGNLEYVEIKLYNPNSISGTFNIYAGENNTGSNLYTQAYNTAGTTGNAKIVLTSNFQVIAGNVYTFYYSSINTFGNYRSPYVNYSNPYSSGKAYSNGSLFYGGLADWKFDLHIEPLAPTYVNLNATGNNDGTSWTNAYTDLQDAFTVTNSEIWVAQGVYIPNNNSANPRKSSFIIDKINRVYGGFNGTETSLSDRDINTNPTILSGDVNNDDNSIITDETDVTRQDNLYHVISVKGHFATSGFMDGFTITSGNANGSLSNSCSTPQDQQYDRSAAAIYANPDGGSHTVFMKFTQCIIENNTATIGAISSTFGPCGASGTRSTLDFESCIMRNNYTKLYENMYFGGSQNYDNRRYGSIVNCLLHNNKTDGANRGSVLLLSSGGSGNYPACEVNIDNSTFTNNISPNNYALKISMTNLAGHIYNSIIYGNGSSLPIAFAGTVHTASNNIIEGGQYGGNGNDPLFINSTNNNFTLQAASSAIDAGDNSVIPAGIFTDLNGYDRIYNTTVDIGCYEYDPANVFVTYSLTTSVNGSGSVSPSGITTHNDGTVVSVTATPISGWSFDGWSGASSSVSATINVTMDADKTLTANFSQIQYELTILQNTGIVTPNSGTLNNGVYVYNSGTSVDITAVANTGYIFDHYEITDSNGTTNNSANPLSITMNDNITVEAIFILEIVLFVDVDATGANDGTSWADAYISLQTALANVNSTTTSLWIAEGIYKPYTSDNLDSFEFLQDDIAIYGGFDATETTLADRDLTANHNTILSGDLNGNDTGVVSFFGTDLNDNSYTVVKVLANGITLDGLSINDGHAINGGLSDSTLYASAAGIHILNTITSFTLKNCQLNNNSAQIAPAIQFFSINNATINIENCIFNNNLGKYATLYFLSFANNKTLNVNITNSLFINNETKDLASGNNRGYTGSAAWIRAYSQGTIVNTTISNCTFANNHDNGTYPGIERGPLALTRRTPGNSTHNAIINNSIFYGNTMTSGNTHRSINEANLLLANTVSVNNSIGQDGFSNIITLVNTSYVNPLFTNSSVNDFTLQSGSPAIDTGDNSLIPVGIIADLLQNNRIFNTTVDMGCYEYGSSPVVAVNDINNNLIFMLYPNPVKDVLNIIMDEEITKVTIYNLQGQQVMESKEKQLNVSQLSIGFYLLKVETIKGNIATKRFIKK